jgi:hypothetical protein
MVEDVAAKLKSAGYHVKTLHRDKPR